MGSKMSVDLAQKDFVKANEIYKKIVEAKGEGSDEAFAAEEQMKKAQKIAKYEKAYFKSNIEFKKAEKSVVDEKKIKKRALVKETRAQLKESIDMFRFTKRNGSKNQLKLIKREIRGNRKSIGKITKVETSKHNYLKKKRQVAWAYKKAGQRLERIIATKFRKQKRIYRQAVKAGRRRATAKAKKMLEAIKLAHAKTQAKILKVKIAEARENVKFSKENIAIAK